MPHYIALMTSLDGILAVEIFPAIWWSEGTEL